MESNVITNNVFNGVVWDESSVEVLMVVAKALLNLTEVFKSQNIKIESLLKVESPKQE